MAFYLSKVFKIKKIYKATSDEKVIDCLDFYPIDLIITDVIIENLKLGQIKRLKKDYTRIIVLTDAIDKRNLKYIQKNKIKIILDKQNAKQYLKSAIENALNGYDVFYSNNVLNIQEKIITSKKKQNNGVFPLLTEREDDILPYLAKGYNDKEIADKLFLSKSTVNKYRISLYEKFQVNSAAKLTYELISLGIVTS